MVVQVVLSAVEEVVAVTMAVAEAVGAVLALPQTMAVEVEVR